MTGETALVGIILGGVLALREWQSWRVHRDLMDRLMSADFVEFKRLSSPRRSPGVNVRMTDEEMAKAERER